MKVAERIAASLTAADVAEFGAAVERRFGHAPGPLPEHGPDDRLRAVLETRLRATSARTYAQYRKRLEQDHVEWALLAPLLTVPETYFFRMPEHFEAMISDALPLCMQARAEVRTLKILSAGCATGEEPYTMRMMLDERVPALAKWRVQIDGVDLSAEALTRARAGVYSEWSLRATSEARRKRWFSPLGKTFRLDAAARTGVSFAQENLLDEVPASSERYDIIFCRNVLIYFTEEAMRVALARLTTRLVPGGFLFLGPAESLRGVSRNYHLCHARDTFFYRRKDDAELAELAEAERRLALSPAPARGPFESWYEAIRSSSERLAGLSPAGPALGVRPGKTLAAASPSIVTSSSFTASPLAPPRFLQMVQAEQFAEAMALLDTLAVRAEEKTILRAMMLINLGRYAEAEADCRGLLAAGERNPASQYLFGLCREQAGALDEAEERMCLASTLDPAFAMAHLHRALIARRRGKVKEARASFQRALHAVDLESGERMTLFGGGFSREGLRKLCTGELARLEAQGGVR